MSGSYVVNPVTEEFPPLVRAAVELGGVVTAIQIQGAPFCCPNFDCNALLDEEACAKGCCSVCGKFFTVPEGAF